MIHWVFGNEDRQEYMWDVISDKITQYRHSNDSVERTEQFIQLSELIFLVTRAYPSELSLSCTHINVLNTSDRSAPVTLLFSLYPECGVIVVVGTVTKHCNSSCVSWAHLKAQW